MLLADFFANYYRPLRLRGKSPRTSALYHNTITQYGRWLGRLPTVEEDLDDLQISRYLEARCETRSQLTSERERNQLCAMWRLACDRNLLQVRPCIPPLVIPERVPQCWTPAEVSRLVKTCCGLTGMIGDLPRRIFWTSLTLTLYQSAERCGAILAVHKDQYRRPTILVRAEQRKGRKRDKLHQFSEDVCDLLDTMLASKNGPLLFSWPKNHNYLWHCFGEIVKRAGLGEGRREKFHALRRAAATHFAAGGGDPVSLLDHSSPRITRAYLDPRQIDSGPAPWQVLPKVHGATR
jgi:integrase